MTPKRILFPVLLAVAAGCDDPGAVLTAPPVHSMTLFVILDPDRDTQPTLVKPARPDGLMPQLSGVVRRDGATVASVQPSDDLDGNSFHVCAARYGGLTGVSHPRCLNFALRAEFGGTYTVSASAPDYPTARGTATVPGDFRLVRVEAQGDPPGTGRLEAAWTRSEGAYRYVVALRSVGLVECLHRRPECASDYEGSDWLVATADTSISTVVPAEAVARGQGGWVLDVYAMERNVYEYLTTGSVSQPFPVPPVQNVVGGYGSVGAWVRRSHHF